MVSSQTMVVPVKVIYCKTNTFHTVICVCMFLWRLKTSTGCTCLQHTHTHTHTAHTHTRANPHTARPRSSGVIQSLSWHLSIVNTGGKAHHMLKCFDLGEAFKNPHSQNAKAVYLQMVPTVSPWFPPTAFIPSSPCDRGTPCG